MSLRYKTASMASRHLSQRIGKSAVAVVKRSVIRLVDLFDANVSDLDDHFLQERKRYENSQ